MSAASAVAAAVVMMPMRFSLNIAYRSASSCSGSSVNSNTINAAGLPKKWPIAGVTHVLMVSSAKGGVGKSTLAVNLAVALSHIKGCEKVGLLDADVYGPSIPMMMGIDSSNTPVGINARRRMEPLVNYGIKCMSMGFIANDDDDDGNSNSISNCDDNTTRPWARWLKQSGPALIWRGPMVMKAVEQLIRGTAWGRLDVLVVDMPPGTGDVQLTISQQVPISGAVIVSTPQDIALVDAEKGAAMFTTVGVPVLGLVQNMSSFMCPNCGHCSSIFGSNGVESAARAAKLPLLADIPLDPDVRKGADCGQPIVLSKPDSAASLAYKNLASTVFSQLPEWQDPFNTKYEESSPDTPSLNDQEAALPPVHDFSLKNNKPSSKWHRLLSWMTQRRD